MLLIFYQDEDDCTGTMRPLPEDSGTLVPSHDLPDTGTLVSGILDLGTMVINSDTDTEATMKSWLSIKLSFTISMAYKL